MCSTKCVKTARIGNSYEITKKTGAETAEIEKKEVILQKKYGSHERCLRENAYLCAHNLVYMETITINSTTYNYAKEYAKSQNLSVDKWIVKLINTFLQDSSKKKRFKMLPVEELAPELQEIMRMPIVGSIDADDISAEEERKSYYKEKYSL